jgi:predicted GIY-YIG superfamily endonuclease
LQLITNPPTGQPHHGPQCLHPTFGPLRSRSLGCHCNRCTNPARPHTLYRIYDTDNVLLYIGVTATEVATRVAGHRSTQPWADDIDRWTSEPIGTVTRVAANRIERNAIQSESPTHNIYGRNHD